MNRGFWVLDASLGLSPFEFGELEDAQYYYA